MQRFHAGDREGVAFQRFHGANRLTQRLGRIKTGDVCPTAMQEEWRKSAIETFFQGRRKIKMTPPIRGSAILCPTGKDRIQSLTVIGRYVLHVRNLLQSSLNLQGRDTSIQQLLQLITTIHIFQRKEMFARDNLSSLRVNHPIGQAAILRTLPSIGTTTTQSGTQVTLSAIADTQRPMHENLQRHGGLLRNRTDLR